MSFWTGSKLKSCLSSTVKTGMKPVMNASFSHTVVFAVCWQKASTTHLLYKQDSMWSLMDLVKKYHVLSN